MKFISALTLAFATAFSLAASAAGSEFFGHWQAKIISQRRDGIFTTGTDPASFKFTADAKSASFLRCAKAEYPEKSVFLSGQIIGSGRSEVYFVDSAYVCLGEVGLSTCEAQDQQRVCTTTVPAIAKAAAEKTVQALYGRKGDKVSTSLLSSRLTGEVRTEVWNVTLSNGAQVGSADYEVTITSQPSEKDGDQVATVVVKYLGGT